MDPALRLHPNQQALTPAQEAEARRFAAERIQAQLSTEPVDEQEAESFLRQAYAVARLPPPHTIHWVDGPLQLVAALAPQRGDASVRDSVRRSLEASVRANVETSVLKSVWASVGENARERVRERVWDSMWDRLGKSAWVSVRASVWDSGWERVWLSVRKSLRASVWKIVDASVEAYRIAPALAFYRFFDEYLAPNDLAYLAHFNERVSGYWLGHEEAIVVRRPHVISLDAEGRLHSATSKCIEYPDGWGFWAWHGVRVPAQVILAPETLTREDFLNEENVEVRRVIQERMGERFLSELGGQVTDPCARGTLYEVRLPEDDFE